MPFGSPDHGEVDISKLKGLVDAGFTVPDLVGTVEGWRAWNVRRDPPPYGNPPKLESATYSYVWAPRQTARAECSISPEHVPGEACSCGFYAAKSLKHLRTMGYHSYHEQSDRITVIAQLAMWGKVIEGTQGWRSEFAYPAQLFLPFEGWRLGKPLAKAWGVPVRLLNILDPSKFPSDGKVIDDGQGEAEAA